MSKVLKWAGKTVIIIAVILALFSVTLYFLVQLPAVQTMLVRQVTHSIRQQLPQSSIAIGSVHYSFFNKLIVNDIYASDIHGDTLLYVQTAAVNISSYNFTTRALTISAVHLYDGVFNLYDGPETNNINELLRKLPEKDSVPDGNSPELDLQVKDIVLSDFRFTYRNLRKPTKDPGPDVIDFKDLAVSNIHVNIENLKMRQDTIFFRIKDINFHEKSGYRVRKLSAEQAYVCANRVMLEKLIIDDEHSLLTLNYYSMDFNSRLDFKDYTEKVVMSADFDNALFSLSTLNHYAEGFHADSVRLRLHGTAGGTVEKLRSQWLSISTEDGRTALATACRITGLPDIHQTAFTLNIHSLNTNADGLSHILRDLVREAYTPPVEKMIMSLGEVQFKGSFNGLYNDFVVCGDVGTSIGEVSLDMLFHKTAEKSFTAEGHTVAKQFNLGNFLHLKPLGIVSTNAETRLTFRPSDDESFHLNMSGNVSQLEFNRYIYTRIKVDGLLSNRSFEGEVQSNDPNLMMDFKGYVAFNKGDGDSTFVLRHNYTADIRHANLRQLHFNTRDSISELKTQLTANYQYYQDFDDGTGKLEAAGAFYRNHSGVHNIGTVSLLLSRGESGHSAKLSSGFADAHYRGPLPLSAFIQDFLYDSYLKQLPLSDDSSGHNYRTSNYTFDVQFKRINGLASIIHPELTIGDKTGVKTTLTPSGVFSVNVDSPMLALGNDYVQKVTLHGTSRDSLLNLQLNVSSAKFLGFDFNNIAVGIDAADNNIDTKINFHNNSRLENKGALHFSTSFMPDSSLRSAVVNINLHPSTVTVNDTTWSVAPANVTINNRTLSVNSMSFYNQHQQIALQGVISPAKTDTLVANLHNFDVSNFNTFSQREGYNLKGVLSGNARIAGVYDELMFYADFLGERIAVNDRPLDHITVKSSWDNELRRIRLNAEIKKEGNTRLQLNGIYAPEKDSLHFLTSFHHFHLVNVEPLLSSVLSDINGYLSGEVTVKGPLKSPQLYGTNVVLDSAGLTVDYLKTHYTVTAPVDITPGHISIREAEIIDHAGGKGTLNGTFNHRAFQNITYNVNITSNNLLCMNTTVMDNDLFYGKAYATGMILIKGDDSNIHFDIMARTNPNTICYIPLSNTSRAKTSSVLIFKEPEKRGEEAPVTTLREETRQHVTVAMNLTATPDAEVQIVFDEKAGDIVRGSGNGILQLNLDPSAGKFDIFGDYVIDQGEYFFTLLSKKFIIEQGSHILFNGDINRTSLDIIALYKTKAPLNTLIMDTTSVGNVRRPADCRINITGNLFNPTLTYKVDVQNLDPSTRAQVGAALNTEEKMSRQFLSLLAFNSFMPEDQSGISNIDLSASASEVFSNQLNNMLSQLGSPVDVNFIYNPTAGNEQGNVDVALSAQLFDSRLQISAMGNTRRFNSNIAGEIDIEVKLDKQGLYRGKAFSHSSDQFTDQLDNSQRSGIGFIYQRDFNTFKELFGHWFRRRKEEKPTDE